MPTAPVTPVTRSLTAIVATRVYEPEGTAAAYRLGALVRALEGSGYRVTVLTSRVPDGPASTKRVRRWPVLRDRSGAVRGYVQYLSFDIPLFFRLLFARRADVVVVEPPPTTGLSARVACWLRRTPYVYYSADVLSSAVEGIGTNRLVVAAVRWLERRSVRGARGVLAVSEEVRDKVIALGAKPDQVSVIGTGIDTEKFTVHGPVAPTERPYFIYAGTMSEVHGAGVFVDAFERVTSRHPEVELRVFGAGVEADDFLKRARTSRDRVKFSGIVTADELAPWIRGAVAGLASVRPDRGYDFAFATKALASLACGTPVIYSGVGPLATSIDEHALGWAVDWESRAVEEAMLAALESDRGAPDNRLSEWVESNHSLRAIAAKGATAITRWLRMPESQNHLG